jgi:hypothetical protein
MPRKKTARHTNQQSRQPKHSTKKIRNRALHIPLDFEKAVEGLLNVKPKKKNPKK